MAWYDNLKNALHPYDDEYMENEAAAAEEEFEDFEPAPQEPVYEEPRNRSFSKKSSAPPPQPERGKMKLVFVTPSTFDEAVEIADHLRSRRAVLMNIESCDADTSRRLLDFMSGVAYALGGRVNRVSARAFVITPVNVDLVGDAVEDFESNGIYF